MTHPVNYVELHSADRSVTAAFFRAVFDWDPQPFADPGYVVAPAGGAGVDTGILTSRDGTPRTVPIVTVPSIEALRPVIDEHGGTVVVEPFVIPGVGRGCYFTDPTGLIVGLHEYDPDAR